MSTSNTNPYATSKTAGERDQRDNEGRLKHLRERLSEGTESLSEAARERVIAARQRAIEARGQASRAMHRGTDSATDMFERQPLVIGALAFAVGAAVAALLPKTKVEDSYLGARRDALMDEAERIFQDEKARAERALNAAQSELKTAASDATEAASQAVKDAASKAENKAHEAADRVADKASSAANK